jgi:effector-binding domain-containing protein
MRTTRTPATTDPQVIHRAAQPYVAIRKLVTLHNPAEITDELPELLGWLARRRIEPVGPLFFKYSQVRMLGLLDLEVGIPVATATSPATASAADGRVLAGVLPEGRFASVTHAGHPDELLEVTAELLDWGSERGLGWDLSETGPGQTWGLRLELYRTDPALQRDPSDWETELIIRLAA